MNMSYRSKAAFLTSSLWGLWVAFLTGALLTLADPTNPATAAETVTIEIGNYSFAPSDVTIAPGTTVVWVNHDEMVHTIISTDRLFGSKGMDTDDRYSFTFDKEGDYGYLCSLHPYMTGMIKVRRP
jgi:plastocyanin